MGTAQAGEHADGGLDDIPECQHLAGLTDASLEDAHFRLFVKQPYGEGHTNLRVVATRGTDNALRGQE